MDGTAPELVLDKDGVCNFCHDAQRELALAEKNKPDLPKIIERIKRDGLGKQYDCLIGLSGGVDSSTLLHNAVKLGLRPLCYSIDNGYNDPKADENIMRLVETLKVPFYRYTIDLRKFADLQNAFIKAGQINIEIPTDHILMASSFEMASRYGIKWILSGGNVATESIMPASWSYTARDLVHIKDVYKKMTGKKLTEYRPFFNLISNTISLGNKLPLCSLSKFNWYKWIKRIKTFYLLDYIDYNRADSIKMLEDTYGFKNYHEKHCESLFTWWFQNYYLFQKFGIDKRKPHYSSLINSGQMTRKEAMDLLADRPIYPELGIEKKVMQYAKRPYTDFATDERIFKFISRIIKFLRKWKF